MQCAQMSAGEYADIGLLHPYTRLREEKINGNREKLMQREKEEEK